MPRDVDLYLLDILDAIENIQNYTSELSYYEFTLDKMCIDAVIKNFLIIGEAVKKIPDDMKDDSSFIDWKNIAGLRDVLIHAYFRIDNEILWDIIENKLAKLGDEIIRMRNKD